MLSYKATNLYMYIDREKLHLAHRLLRLFILRRLKSEVEQKLLPKLETKINCHMTPLQLACIRKLLLNESSLLMRSESMDLSVADGKRIKSLMVCRHNILILLSKYIYMLPYICECTGSIKKGCESSVLISR